MKDSSLKTERDVEFALRLPVLAMIPEIEPDDSDRASEKQEPILAGVGSDHERKLLGRLCTRNSSDYAKARSM